MIISVSGKIGIIINWNTAKEAGNLLNINIQAIGQCSRGKSKTAGGYMWNYNKYDYIEPPKYTGKTKTSIINNLK